MSEPIVRGCVVVCINNEKAEYILSLGRKYTVEHTTYDGNVLFLEGVADSFGRHRFEVLSWPDETPFVFTENENVFPFDVDKTLVSNRRSCPTQGDIGILNPYTLQMSYVRPHIGHVDLLKEMHGRGRYTIVWSASGVKWARAVVEALGVQDYVNQIITKPIGYVDDQPAESWMKNHVYLNESDRV